MDEIIGFKGFDKNLVCKETQFEIGKTYSIPETPKLCQRGFHFSRTLKQAMVFYPNVNGNRYCQIRAFPDIEQGDGKCVTNKMEILKELTNQDICATLDGINLAILKDANMNGGIICGSLALKLQGFDLGREIKDIDFIFPNNDNINKVFRNLSIAMTGSWIIEDKQVKNRRAFYDRDYNKTYDVFIKDGESYREVDYYGEKIKVADPLKIWDAKLKYAFGGNVKHAKDFEKFKHRLSYSLLIRDNTDLQF